MPPVVLLQGSHSVWVLGLTPDLPPTKWRIEVWGLLLEMRLQHSRITSRLKASCGQEEHSESAFLLQISCNF